MKTRTHIAHGALVSMAAAVAIGCGGAGASSDSGEHERRAGADAAIVALGPAGIDGCQLTMAFDITAPSSIGWIAVTNLTQSQAADASRRTQFALWEIDENRQQHRVQTTAITASTQILKLLQQATDTSFLSHVANVAVSDQTNHFMQTATDQRDVSGADTTQTHQSDVLNQVQGNDVSNVHAERDANGATVAAAREANAADATQVAAAQHATQAAQNASSSAASGATSGQSFALGALSAMPIGGVDPAAFAAGVLNDAAWTRTGQASEQAAFGAGQAVSSIANRGAGALDAQGSAQSGASTDLSTSDANAHVDRTVGATQTTSATRTADELATIVTDRVAHADNASDGIAEQRTQTAGTSSNASSGIGAQNTCVLADLASLQSRHFVLEVALTASQAQAAFVVYQGAGNQVFASQQVAQTMPACAGVAP